MRDKTAKLIYWHHRLLVLAVGLRALLLGSPVGSLNGLLPKLADRFGGDWQRFQVHPWDFKNPDATKPYKVISESDSLTALRSHGLRLRSCSSTIGNDKGLVTTQNIVLGYILQTGSNSTDAQLLASEFQEEVDLLIHEWSQNCAPLYKEVEDIGGTIALATRPGETATWNCIVTREFDIVYV